MEFPFKNYATCNLISCFNLISVTGSEDKTPQASLAPHAASSHANQSQSLKVTDNDDEPIGDRWDEDEDWGSLEVGFHRF